MSLEQGKSLGGIGAILLVIGSFIPFLGIVGIILVLLGMRDLARHYNDDSIYRNALWGLIFGIVAIVGAGVVIVSLIFGGALFGMFLGPFGGAAGGFFGLFAGIIAAVIVAFIFYILQAVYYRRAFDSLASKSGEGMFRTAGMLLLVGAILTIIIIGLLLIFIAWIIAAVAFFSIKTTAPTPSAPPPPPSPP